jgi:uncharacterized membrane protein YkvA (DUF1232 family)
MPDKEKQKSIVSGNFLRDMGDYFRLVLRLMGDERVSPILKLLPIAGAVYMVSPLDAFIPYVDDLGVIGVALYMFVEMCPPAVVEEHRQALRGVITGAARDAHAQENRLDEDVIDAEYREEK